MVSDIGSLAAIGISGYLLGAFPTAYLIVTRFAGKNILEWGTGNVGTLNVLRATSSKLLTLAILAGDVLKGVLAMLVGFTIAVATGLDSYTGAATVGPQTPGPSSGSGQAPGLRPSAHPNIHPPISQ